MDHLLYTHDGTTETVSFDDGAGVLAVFQELTGEIPPGHRGEERFNSGYITYEWSAVSVSMLADEQAGSWVVVSAPEVGGVPIRTVEGIQVGMTRDEALAAGARDGYDEDQDGDSDTLQVGRQEVPGTRSYMNGGVGIRYMVLTLEGDTVSQMATSGDDFNDI